MTTNPFSITYGERTVGGSSTTYRLNGPYVIDKSFERLRLVFEVVVVATSYASLQTLADDLETDFRKRDQDLTINLSGSEWSYVMGTGLLNPRATLQKTGNRDTDRGFSRAYTIVVDGDLPAEDQDGLRSLEVHVDYTPGRQKIVTMRGEYTAIEGTLASEQYLSEFDNRATTILTTADGSATWEMVDEQYTRDRLDHVATFSRQYTQLLADQASGQRDDDEIRDHRFTFTDLSQNPGDGLPGIQRLRRVVGTYDCSVDIDETTDLQGVWNDKVVPLLVSEFQSAFDPTVFAIEDLRVAYDKTASRVSGSVQFVYQKSGGSAVVAIMQSLAYREARTIDYTPVHNGSEFAAEADAGWTVRERVWTRTVAVLGSETPKKRIGERAEDGNAGLFDDTLHDVEGIDSRNDGKVQKTGWNITHNSSQVATEFIGMPGFPQIEHTILTETVVERFHEAPAGGGGPQTPGGG